MDLAKVPFDSYLEKKSPLDQAKAQKFLSQMVRATSNLHDSNIVHRDIKPENFLLMEKRKEKYIVLCDFGLSKIGKDRKPIMSSSFCGTPLYMAPEVICLGNPKYDCKKSDVWSIGVTLYQMLTKAWPFDVEMPDKGLKQMEEENWVWPKGLKITSILDELVHSMLNPEVADRMSIKDIIEHEWVAKAYEKTVTLERKLFNTAK